jgi:hypothetical protein
MRKPLVIAAILAVSAGGAMAQVPRAVEGPQNPAIATDSDRKPAGPVKGANSFTEGEAKSRLEDRGFTNITALRKDDDGIWRGRAMRAGQPVEVALDYQGNVFHGVTAPAAAGPNATGTTGAPTQPRPAQGGAGR